MSSLPSHTPVSCPPAAPVPGLLPACCSCCSPVPRKRTSCCPSSASTWSTTSWCRRWGRSVFTKRGRRCRGYTGLYMRGCARAKCSTSSGKSLVVPNCRRGWLVVLLGHCGDQRGPAQPGHHSILLPPPLPHRAGLGPSLPSHLGSISSTPLPDLAPQPSQVGSTGSPSQQVRRWRISPITPSEEQLGERRGPGGLGSHSPRQAVGTAPCPRRRPTGGGGSPGGQRAH